MSRLIRHQSYQFASPIPGGTVESVDAITGKPRHGPHNLDCITEAAYEQTDGPSALAYLLHSIDEESHTCRSHTPVPTPDVALEALQRLEITLASATEVFRLRELEEHCYARHRYLGAWCELIVADTNARETQDLHQFQRLERSRPHPRGADQQRTRLRLLSRGALGIRRFALSVPPSRRSRPAEPSQSALLELRAVW